MKNILIVVAHPNIAESVVNRQWVNALKQYPDRYTVHELYQQYPDGVIDIEKEQKIIEQHGSLILQFPVYWFNCTPLLKQWLDDVFTYGWAYGSKGNQLKNKKMSLAVSAGITEHDFSKEGPYQHTLQDILRPFEITAQYIKADYQPFFAVYDTHNLTTEGINQSIQNYIEFLSHF